MKKKKEEAPVDYDTMVNYAGFDGFKIACQEAGRVTAENLKRSGFKELTWSRGESAYVMEAPWCGVYLATVEEGLGTKNYPADLMRKAIHEASLRDKLVGEMGLLLGRSFYREVAQCNVAMVENDLITSGASPLAFMLHLAVQDAKWFERQGRWQELIQGTVDACNLAGCSWGGGETPVLMPIIAPEASLLSGSSVGFISKQRRLINPANIKDGDAIIFFESSGAHSNGYTMLWNVIVPRLSNGYLTIIPEDGRTFGEAILAPTNIYSEIVQACLNEGVHIHYAVNITGHGFCKLMRAVKPFTYVIDKLPKQQPLFRFIEEHNPIGRKKMYRTFNMGAGFAIYIRHKDIKKVLAISAGLKHPIGISVAGHIEKSEKKRVVIDPEKIEFKEDDLAIR